MVSSDLLRVAEAVRYDGELPEDARKMLDILLSKISREARAMECLLSPRPPGVPEGCVDLRAERLRRRAVPA